jgi:hypothetical protein
LCDRQGKQSNVRAFKAKARKTNRKAEYSGKRCAQEDAKPQRYAGRAQNRRAISPYGK